MYWITCSFVCIKWQLQLPPYKGPNHFKSLHEALSRAGLSIPLIPWNRLSRRAAKLTKWHVRQVKTQINLDIHPVWSEKLWVRGYQLSAQRRLIRLGGSPGWSASSPCACITCFVSLLPKIKIIISYVPYTPKLSLFPCWDVFAI